MSNINAAIGLAQFEKLDEFINRKRDIVRFYNENFDRIRQVELIDWNLEEAAPFTYIIRIVNGQRDKLMDFLKSQDIGSGVHYIANHIQPFFKKYASPLPITEKVWQEILTLPLYYDMTDKDASKVVTAVKDFFNG